ncbi:hypothetical protein MCOR14_009450 [Pyricularia oryzae]|nr:hypothetical protein MCOR14_009450 [Pyricularia oryzae]
MELQLNVKLQSKKHRALFDIINKLRSDDIGQVVDLPEIIPGPERTAENAARLRDFCDTLAPNIPLDEVIEAAKDAMGLGTSKRFSTDVLRVQISGPDQHTC